MCVLLTPRETFESSSMLPQAPSRVAESKRRVNPTSANVIFRDETKLLVSGRMICAFIPYVLPMTVDIVHSDSQPQLGLEQESLTGQTLLAACSES